MVVRKIRTRVSFTFLQDLPGLIRIIVLIKRRSEPRLSPRRITCPVENFRNRGCIFYPLFSYTHWLLTRWKMSPGKKLVYIKREMPSVRFSLAFMLDLRMFNILFHFSHSAVLDCSQLTYYQTCTEFFKLWCNFLNVHIYVNVQVD